MKIDFKTVCELDEAVTLLKFAGVIFDEFCEKYILSQDKRDLIYDAKNRAESLSNFFLAGETFFNQAKNALERILQDA